MAEWLTMVSVHHKEWVSLVKSWGEKEMAEDLVQEMYLRLLQYTTPEKIIKDGKVNKSFVWITLRNMHFSLIREKKKIEKIRIGTGFEIEDEQSEIMKHEATDLLIDQIESEIDSFHWYDKKMFELHVKSGMSMRYIEKGTKISLTSIHNTIKKCKEKIRTTNKNQINSFLNEDYESIKIKK